MHQSTSLAKVNAVMPFGCLALRDGRIYDSMSDVTDKYEIGQVLRAKEFCELCLAKDRQTDKVFVCKKFLKKDGRKVRKAAKNEIMILKLVNHPNILQLIDTFETRKEYFIIQELATGGDVFDWILDQGNYTERDASNVIRQVLEAVAYLHSLNIVHRNLKLENLMYYTENNHNKVVLRDFYLSRFENGPITEPCGTPEYLAPEVVARHRYGRPVDCWAVGVIMFILLSGNPPFYDETEEENTDLHNRIIFCRIVAGEFEFDSPYWDDISPAAKELVCRLMEVDQMLRITAQDALWHEWIAGNGASEKNLKDGVCAQFEKNFAKAKWRKAIRVTTFMQRLKNSEALIDSSAEVQGSEEAGDGEGGVSQGTSDEGEKGASDGGVTSSNVSLEVTVENRPAGIDQDGEKQEEVKMSKGPSVKISPSDIQESLCQSNAAPKLPQEESDKIGAKKAAGDGTRKIAANLGQNKVAPESTPTPVVTPKPPKLTDGISGTKHPSTSPDPSSKRKMAATLHGPPPTASAATTASPENKPEATQKEQKDETDGSWCQTQLPEAVAERSVGAPVTPAIGPGTGVDAGPGVRLRGDASPVVRKDKDARKTDRYSAEFSIARAGPATGQGCYTVGSSASLGRHATPYNPEVGTVGMGIAGSYGSPYSSLYTTGGGVGMYGTGLHHGGGGSSTTSDWQMDSVIEQIEKQMAAVLEKIEGDMPSLLEQISDCPPEPPRARSTHASPATSRTRSSQHSSTESSATPPPLPTSPRPALPSLPRLTIPPPSYPPPSPPTQATGEQEDRDGQRGTARPSQSPRAGMGRGL
ncbi:caM kinase-like vesicle-associated, like isoform X1 [Thunnus thynnus]|uniref:caM kinase-like vesicle-associated, like isoform X1 n=2 Tax=Thunnus thynnus TaxID=8237 RepID=UPI003527F290